MRMECWMIVVAAGHVSMSSPLVTPARTFESEFQRDQPSPVVVAAAEVVTFDASRQVLSDLSKSHAHRGSIQATFDFFCNTKITKRVLF